MNFIGGGAQDFLAWFEVCHRAGVMGSKCESPLPPVVVAHGQRLPSPLVVVTPVCMDIEAQLQSTLRFHMHVWSLCISYIPCSFYDPFYHPVANSVQSFFWSYLQSLISCILPNPTYLLPYLPGHAQQMVRMEVGKAESLKGEIWVAGASLSIILSLRLQAISTKIKCMSPTNFPYHKQKMLLTNSIILKPGFSHQKCHRRTFISRTVYDQLCRGTYWKGKAHRHRSSLTAASSTCSASSPSVLFRGMPHLATLLILISSAAYAAA